MLGTRVAWMGTLHTAHCLLACLLGVYVRYVWMDGVLMQEQPAAWSGRLGWKRDFGILTLGLQIRTFDQGSVW